MGAIDQPTDRALRVVADHLGISGVIMVRDEPVMAVATRLPDSGRVPATATVHPGQEVAIAPAARQHFLHGVAAACPTILALPGRPIPTEMTIPGVFGLRGNPADRFQPSGENPRAQGAATAGQGPSLTAPFPGCFAFPGRRATATTGARPSPTRRKPDA